jgi:4-amino-4-deoxy-L-arabinose transferase-like glycosyltransferase
MQVKSLFKGAPFFYTVLFIVILIGFGLRIFYLEQYPLAANQDELSNIYDGYSIAETGADRWGQKYPMILRAFGTYDYRPPLYAWLSAATIRVFGFSLYSGRLVSALLGCASLILIYGLAKRIGGKLFALSTLLIATFSPWHILFSRIASEGTMLPPFFLISACYLWQKSKDNYYSLINLIILGLCIGLGTNTYQSGKLIFFLFTVLFLIDFWKSTKQTVPKTLIFGAACLVGASPQIISMVATPEHFFSRASESTVAFSFSFDYFNTLFRNITSYFTPDYLFFSFKNYSSLSVGRLLMPEFIAFYVGLFFLYKVFNKTQAIKPIYFYILLIIAVLPSTLTRDNPHALRSSCLIVLLPFITATGIIVIYRQFSNSLVKFSFLALTFIAIIWNGIFYIKTYIKSNELRSHDMQVLLVKACQKLNTYKDDYQTIYMEPLGNQPYIYTLFYCNVRPQEFQTANKEINGSSWDDFRKMDKYYFMSTGEIEEQTRRNNSSKTLILLRAKNHNYEVLDSVENENEKVYFHRK